MSSLVSFFKLLYDYWRIPNSHSGSEIILRNIYYKVHYNGKRLTNQTFYPSFKKKHNLSVLRLDYTNLTFCNSQGLKGQGNKRKYCGYLTLKVEDVEKIRSGNEVVPRFIVTKTFDIKNRNFLPMHGDIVIYNDLNGKPLEFNAGQPIDIDRGRIAKKLIAICELKLIDEFKNIA